MASTTAAATTTTTRRNAQQYLTKSLFQLGVSCPRKLLYATRRGEFPMRTETNVLLQSLAEQGRLWERYACTKRFPHAHKVTPGTILQFETATAAVDDKSTNTGMKTNVNEALTEALIQQTQQLLLGKKQVAILQGAVRYDNFLIRPDVLEYLPCNSSEASDDAKKGTLRITEIKAKSWNTQSDKDLLWSTRGGIKSDMLPYIHDVAFQKMVVQGAFPQFNVEAYLLLPDKAQTNTVDGLNQLVHTLEDGDHNNAIARETIINTEEDLSAWIDVTEAVRHVLETLLEHPGNNQVATFRTAATEWARLLANASPTLSQDEFKTMIPPPIGAHCKSCEFRLPKQCPNNDVSTDQQHSSSGFDQCWAEQTTPETCHDLEEGKAVVDLWNGRTKNIDTWIAEKKYSLGDLNLTDLGFSENGDELDKKGNVVTTDKSKGISRARRQLYQATGIPGNKPCIVDKDYMQSEVEQWRYPLHFIDFETSVPVIPYFSRMAPFDVVAFQFSHHILHEDGKTQHVSEFLQTEPGVNPNTAFLLALAESVGDCQGSVFRWGVHENTVLKSLLQTLEDGDSAKSELEPLLVGQERAMFDLQKIATLGYYVSGSDASSSIKKLLLPTMTASQKLEQIYGSATYSSRNFTNMQWFQRDENGRVVDPYDILKEHTEDSALISDGGGALAAYHTLQTLQSSTSDGEDQRRSGLESSLMRYCELDTLAMVMICQAWQEFLQCK